MKTLVTLVLAGSTAWAQVPSQAAQSPYYLRDEDQPHYRNDSNGRNALERMDDAVKEMNRMWGEIHALKRQVAELQAKLDGLEKKRVAP